MRRSSLIFLLGLVACGDGEPGAIARTNVLAEPPGGSCAAGGQRIELGVDRNANGVLDADEIESTSFVCNGEARGADVTTETLAVGDARCPTGGVVVRVAPAGASPTEIRACNGPRGERGAAGPTGGAGAPGPAGPTGPVGAPGSNGNATAVEGPRLGVFALRQIVHGAVLTCDTIQTESAATVCGSPRLNGFAFYGSDADVLCGAVTGKTANVVVETGPAVPYVRWNGASWEVGPGTVSPGVAVSCLR